YGSRELRCTAMRSRSRPPMSSATCRANRRDAGSPGTSPTGMTSTIFAGTRLMTARPKRPQLRRERAEVKCGHGSTLPRPNEAQCTDAPRSAATTSTAPGPSSGHHPSCTTRTSASKPRRAPATSNAPFDLAVGGGGRCGRSLGTEMPRWRFPPCTLSVTTVRSFASLTSEELGTRPRARRRARPRLGPAGPVAGGRQRTKEREMPDVEATTDVRDAFDLSDRVAVLTGAASGIGRATAQVLAGAGATVVLGDVDEKGAQATADEIASRGGTPLPPPTDLTKRGGVDALRHPAAREHGRRRIHG